jgi:hypothetical protein
MSMSSIPIEESYVRLEVFTALTMKNTVFWNLKSSSYLTGDKFHHRYRAQPANAM